jgi:transposase
MAKGRDEAAAKACLEVLTPEQRDAVQFHHTDMGTAFLSACEEGLKNSKSVIDRFHVAKKLGEVADGLRKKTIGPTNEACLVNNGSGCAP